MKRTLLPLIFLFGITLSISSQAQNLKISEVMFHALEVTDTGNEYIEIRGDAGATVAAGTYFVAMSGDGASGLLGQARTVFDLSGLVLGSNGFMVLNQPGNGYVVSSSANEYTASGSSSWMGFSLTGANFRNESITFLLITAAVVPIEGTSYDSNSDGTLDNGAENWTILDAVAYFDGGTFDVSYADITFARSANGFTSGIISGNVIDIGLITSFGYFARFDGTTGSTTQDWFGGRVIGTAPATFNLATNQTKPVSMEGQTLTHVGSANPGNPFPTLSTFTNQVQAGRKNTEIEITFAQMTAKGDEAVGTGTIDAFKVKSVTSGNLRLGASLTTATAFASGTNDLIDGTTNAYWTPADNTEGNELEAFTVVAVDDSGNESSTDVQVPVDVYELYINEVLFNLRDISDTGNEYIELRGTPDVTLPTGCYFLALSGKRNDLEKGELFVALNLAGGTIGSNGYLVYLQSNSIYTPTSSTTVLQPTSGTSWGFSNVSANFRNTSFSYLIAENASNIILDADYDMDDDGVLDGDASDWAIVDAVGFIDNAGDTGYGFTNFAINGQATATNNVVDIGNFSLGYLARQGSSEGSQWVGAGIQGTNTSNLTHISGESYPLASANTILNHLGAANPDFNVWTGAVDDRWVNASNWTDGLPGETDNVIIPLTAQSPRATGTVTKLVNNLEVQDGASLTIESGTAFFINNTYFGPGKVIAKRPALGDQSYNLIGSPFQDATVADLAADFLYEYDGTTFSSATTLNPGQGYFAAYNATSAEISLEGSPNTAAVSVPVSTNGTGFNAVANPFLSPIAADGFLGDNTSTIDGNLWLWDDGGQNVGTDRGGDYITVNGFGFVSGTENLGDGVDGTSTSTFNTFLGSFQGFMVKATTNGNVVFNKFRQTTDTNANSDGAFFRTASEDCKIKLSLSGTDNYNELLVGFSPDATTGKDYSMDGEKFTANEEMSFYTLLDEVPHAIQALPPVESEVVIPLWFDLAKSGTYKLTANELVNTGSLDLFIRDLKTELSHRLDDNFQLSFTVQKGAKQNRFELVARQAGVLSTDSFASGLQVFSKAGLIEIMANLDGEQIVSIHDMSGKTIFKEQVFFDNHRASSDFRPEANQVYILKTQDQSVKFILN